MAEDLEEIKKWYIDEVCKKLERWGVYENYVQAVVEKSKILESFDKNSGFQQQYPIESTAEMVLVNAATVSVRNDAYVQEQDIEYRLTDELKDRKLWYIAYIYKNLEKIGAPKEYLTRIVNKSNLIDVLNAYSEIQMMHPIDSVIKETLITAACAEYEKLENETEAEYLDRLGQNHISVFHFDSEEDFLEELDNA